MYKIFTIEFAILLQILVQIFAENKTKEIEALENEEKKLFKQINHAIDESVTLLKKHNDSEAVVGVDYMMKLKNQLKEINSTGSKDQEAQGSVNDTRRYNKKKLKMDDVAKFLNEKKKKKSDDMLALDNNTIIMKKKVDDWMLQKELEKQKIKEYKLLSKRVGREKCPRFGIGKKHKKGSKNRRSGGTRRKSKKSKKGLPKYPCCRKCCKKSYIGCL